MPDSEPENDFVLHVPVTDIVQSEAAFTPPALLITCLITVIFPGFDAAIAGGVTAREKSRIPIRITGVFRNLLLEFFRATISTPHSPCITCRPPSDG